MNEPQINKENVSIELIPPAAKLKNLPGKNKNKKLTPKIINKPNKCARCSIIYESKVDLWLSKKYWLQNHWIGCGNVKACPCDC